MTVLSPASFATILSVASTASAVTNNSVVANKGGSGAGIYAVGSTLISNTVSGDLGGGQGGGIYAQGGMGLPHLL